MQNNQRHWLIAALSAQNLPLLADDAQFNIAEMAESEGVLLLLAQALQQHPQRAQLQQEWVTEIEQAARPALMAQLAMLAEQRRAIQAMLASGQPFLVLKGGALGHWLYADPSLRLITDLDVLVSDRREMPFLEVEFQKIGYVLSAPAGVDFGLQQAFMRAGGPYGEFSVDVHWQLLNSMQFRDRFSFKELYDSAIEILPGVKGLSPVFALIHACAHRGLNMPFRHATGVQRALCLRWLWDIHLLAAELSDGQWHELCQHCESKQLSALVLDGLQSSLFECQSAVPEFVIPVLQIQTKKLRLSMRPFQSWPVYQWHEFLASADSIFGRLQWLCQRLWPDAKAMRARYGYDGDSDQRVLWRRFAIGLRRLFGMK